MVSVYFRRQEDRLGPFRYGVSTLSGWRRRRRNLSADSVVPMVGASGAIGGVMGAYAVLSEGAGRPVVFLGFFATRVAVPAALAPYWFAIQVGVSVPGGGGEGWPSGALVASLGPPGPFWNGFGPQRRAYKRRRPGPGAAYTGPMKVTRAQDLEGLRAGRAGPNAGGHGGRAYPGHDYRGARRPGEDVGGARGPLGAPARHVSAPPASA